MKKNIFAILWQDAAYTNLKTLPNEIPSPSLSVGFIVDKTKESTTIATNLGYENEVFVPKDGFVIPNKTILSIKKIGNYGK